MSEGPPNTSDGVQNNSHVGRRHSSVNFDRQLPNSQVLLVMTSFRSFQAYSLKRTLPWKMAAGSPFMPSEP